VCYTLHTPRLSQDQLEAFLNRVEQAKRACLDDTRHPDVVLTMALYIYTHEPMCHFVVRPLNITTWQGGEWAARYKHAERSEP
jgi:hypothetical protein